MKIYLIPGLGYDCRIFEKLDFKDLDIDCIKWIEPKLDENIHNYAKRLFSKLDDEKDEIILIGHSLGGIVSQEISTVKRIKKIILISSIKSSKEMPFFFRIVSPLKIYKLFTKEISIKTIKFWGKGHGFESAEEQELFKSMVGSQSNKYLQWALKELSTWKSPKIPTHTKLFQIHGTKDKNFPIKLIDKPNIVIKDAGHIVLYKQAKIMTEILLEEIKTAEGDK